MLFLFVLQVMCSKLIYREDIDIGFVLLGDLQKRCKCVYKRKQQLIDSLKELRSTQLRLMYAAMELEDPSDDIAADVASVRAILYKGIDADGMFNPFEDDISKALGLDDIGAVPLPSQIHLDEVDSLGTPQCEGSPERFVTTSILFSFHCVQVHFPIHSTPVMYIKVETWIMFLQNSNRMCEEHNRCSSKQGGGRREREGHEGHEPR